MEPDTPIAEAAPGESSPVVGTRLVSLYRLLEVDDLRSCIALKALEPGSRFEAREVMVGDRNGLLVSGISDDEPVEWTSMVRSLTSVDLPYTRRVASAALFIDIGPDVFAVTFNHGWRLLRDSRVDREFGVDLAVRLLDQDEVRQVTRWALSSKSRVDRNVVPGGQGLWTFGLREHAELVRGLAGFAREDVEIRLTHMTPTKRRRSPRLRLDCADGVKLRLSVDGDRLVSDLAEISRVLRGCDVAEGLEPLQWVRRVPPGDLKEELDLAVATRLASSSEEGGELGISYPARYLEGPDVVRYTGMLNGVPLDTDDLTLDHLAGALRDLPVERRLQAVRSGRIVGYDEQGQAASDELPVTQWIAAEVTRGTDRHVLLDGEWFTLGEEYVAHVDRVVRQAFGTDPPWRLPRWSEAPLNDRGKVDEGAYNAYVPTADPRFLCLDKKLVTTRAHRRGFEACDLLGPDDALVHVKQTSSATGSSPLSHLFAQGLVAAESFTEPATWRKFREVVAEQDPERASRMGDRPGSLVFAIHRSDKPLSPDTLFTFARSTLVSAFLTLTTYGIPVQVVVIGS
ncbi:DUF6119 family protein [Saccharothrix sp. Mg75]|uniref:DUF6119 family protein n=1 Tax=Saccharothrix sp. Mg75 TaxID=3445357 RepID=UPI003EE909F7